MSQADRSPVHQAFTHLGPQGCAALLLVNLLCGACTYGPEDRRTTIEQIVRIGDSYEAVVTISYERFLPPTGLSAFPDGGRSKVLERRMRLYLVDASQRTVSLLTDQAAPDSLWESFRISVRGLQSDSVAYAQASGCTRGRECYPGVERSTTLRITRRGDVESVAGVPSDAVLPGVMLARAPGEEHYVRFSTEGDFVTARFEQNGSWEPVFQVGPEGTLGVGGG